ncbi:hypothetical protein [Tsuneonella sp. HG222]
MSGLKTLTAHLASEEKCAPEAGHPFVIKARELAALNYLRRDHPKPVALTWINRGTNQKLLPQSVAMLLRTLYRPSATPSVVKLHDRAGLRVTFALESERNAFARYFADAFELHSKRQRSHVTAVFASPELAEHAFKELVAEGIDREAISILWRASHFVDTMGEYPAGHSKLSVASATLGGGLAGAIFGMTLLAIPGIGPIAVGGAVAVQALSAIAGVGGALGATGSAIAKMLTDIDVDNREVSYFEMQIREGKIFVTVDPDKIGPKVKMARVILARNGGAFAS